MEAYLDNSATTMAYPEVGELVYKVMCRDYGNPSSMHRKGVDAEHYVKGEKESLAKLMKVKKGAPLLYIKSVAYTYDREPLYAGAQVFNGEVCSLYVCESVEQ